jgi:hypothetical protein
VDNIVTTTLAFNQQSLPLRTDFVIAGTRCLLSTNSHDILQTVARWRPPTKQPLVSSFEMEVMVNSELDNTPEHSAYFRGLRHLVFALLPPRGFVAYDLRRRRVHAVLSLAAARNPSFWNTLLLPITIGVLGTTVGVVPLHCACLDRDGNGLLVAGVSGAGKSTLATALARLGLAFVSDDWTYISNRQSTLVAHGLSSPVKLLPDATRFFPDLRQFTPRTTLNGELAYEIDPSPAIGFSVKNISSPRRIFFLERSSAPGCHLVPCRSDYVRGFFAKSAERLPSELTEAKAFRASIIRTLSACPSWILRTGESPQRTAEAMDNFLSEANYATASIPGPR